MKNILNKRLWRLFVMTIVGLSLVWIVPNSGKFKPSLLNSTLPEEVSGRIGKELKISDKERSILAEDTTFSRRRYFDTSFKTLAPIDVSVVFSGKDINNSIHRPEICLKAQGWNFVSERFLTHKDITSSVGEMNVKEIVCIRPRTQDDPNGYKNNRGEVIYDKRVQYYTFIGSDVIVAGHYERTWQDIKTRLLEGSDQQWAYITFSIEVENSLNEKNQYFTLMGIDESRVILSNFLKKLMPSMLRNTE